MIILTARVYAPGAPLPVQMFGTDERDEHISLKDGRTVVVSVRDVDAVFEIGDNARS